MKLARPARAAAAPARDRDATRDLRAALAEALRPILREVVREVVVEIALPAPVPELRNVDQICAELQCSRATLTRLRSEGLPSLTVGDSPRFRLADVVAWLERRPGAGT